MSEAEKQYEATPGRRARARREGNVVRSAEPGGVAAFGAATLVAAFAVPFGAGAALAAVRAAAAPPFAPPDAPLAALACAALAVAAAGALAGVAAGLAQQGGLRLAPITVDPRRLDPCAGLKRMFGGEAALGVARATLALAAVLGALLPLGREVVTAGATLASAPAAARLVWWSTLRACGAACAVGAVFAAADYVLARRRWLRGLRMSHDELKRDAKENDGDPQARARRKSAHRAVVRGALSRTREASFVVVNPTHVAVALRYAPPEVPVPEILVRALDAAALRVKAIAAEHGIPLVENAALARLLYAAGERGRPIPAAAYVAVAETIAALGRAGLLA